MVTIHPNILTNDIRIFESQLKKYSIFDGLDVDVIDGIFAPTKTLQVDEVAGLLVGSKDLGIHLMVENPITEVEKLLQTDLVKNPLRIYLHQESNYQPILKLKLPKTWCTCFTVKLETEIDQDAPFYKQFSDIQLMTAETGFRSGKFHEEALRKATRLRDIGYENTISVDGGVNLKTALLIKNYSIGRVSVGSFFANSEDLALDKMKLELALNMKSNS